MALVPDYEAAELAIPEIYEGVLPMESGGEYAPHCLRGPNDGPSLHGRLTNLLLAPTYSCSSLASHTLLEQPNI